MQTALDESQEVQSWLNKLLGIAKANGASAAIAAAEAKREAELAKRKEADGWDEAARLVGHQNKKQRIHYVVNLRSENRSLKEVCPLSQSQAHTRPHIHTYTALPHLNAWGT